VTVISLIGLVLACDNGGGGSGSVNQTPKASDYTVTGTGNNFVTVGEPKFIK